MDKRRLPADEARHLLDRRAALNRRAGLHEPWRIYEEPHGDPDGTTHFMHVRTIGYVVGGAVNVTIGGHVARIGEAVVVEEL